MVDRTPLHDAIFEWMCEVQRRKLYGREAAKFYEDRFMEWLRLPPTDAEIAKVLNHAWSEPEPEDIPGARLYWEAVVAVLTGDET